MRVMTRQPRFAARLASRWDSGAVIAQAYGQKSYGRLDGQGTDDVTPLWGNAVPAGFQLSPGTTSVIPTTVSTHAGLAMRFNGSNSGLRTEELNHSDSFSTLSADSGVMCQFIRRGTTGDNQHIFGGSNPSFNPLTSYGWGFFIANSSTNIWFTASNNGSGVLFNTGIPTEIGQIYTVAGRISQAGTCACAVNGKLFPNLGAAIPYSYTVSLGISAAFDTSIARPFHGDITVAYLRAGRGTTIARGVLLTDGDLVALSLNPWQIFAPPPRSRISSAQIIVPSSDVSAGSWAASTGSDLYAMLDETTPNDADFIFNSNTGSVCEVALQVATDPQVNTGHVVRYRAQGNGVLDLIVKLMQGTTEIASWTETGVPATVTLFEHTLTGTQADAITNYSDLRLRFEVAA